MSLYSLICLKKPKIYFEIGSGNSTKFAKKAIMDHDLNTKIVSVDPHPRTKIDPISDTVVRRPLEEVDLNVFNTLKAGDVLFFDRAHHCFMNSDVTVFFLDVLPRLPSGIIIHIHDIHLPYDYPPERSLHYESEQYFLATMLLAEGGKMKIGLPNKFIVNDAQLNGVLNSLYNASDITIPTDAVSFWIEKIK